MRCERALPLLAVTAVLGGLFVLAATFPAGATAPPVSCADGEGGVRYTAGTLTVADASDAPVSNPFTAEKAITIGNVTLSADGPAFARVERADDGACLSDVNATATPVTVATSDVTVTVEGQVDTLAFEDPAVGGDGLAYESQEPVTVTIADSELPAGTTVEVLDGNGDAREATVAANGSLTLSLPPSDGGSSLTLREAPPETTTDLGSDDNDSDEPTTETTTPVDESDGTETKTGTESAGDAGPGFGVVVALVGLAGVGLLRCR
jgi:PGF-CTERM protein